MQNPSTTEDATKALRRGLEGQNLRWLRNVTTISRWSWGVSQPVRPRRISATMAISNRQQQAALNRLHAARISVSRSMDTATSQQFRRMLQRSGSTVWICFYYPTYPIPSTLENYRYVPKVTKMDPTKVGYSGVRLSVERD